MIPVRQLAAILAAAVTVAQGGRAETFFQDTFDDGHTEDGIPVIWEPEFLARGTYDASTGDYVLSNGTVMISTVPEYVLSDTSIRLRGRLYGVGGRDDFIGAGVRRGSVFGYAAGLSREGFLDIVRVDRNFRPTLLASRYVPFNSADQDVVLQFEALGSELRLWAWPANSPMPDEPQLRASDATYAEGTSGVAAFAPRSGEAVFRFVHVADQTIPRLAGDFTFESVVDVEDIDLLASQIKSGMNNPAFDLNADAEVNGQDLVVWVSELKGTYFGDANLDGEFNSSDLLVVFQHGEYEDGQTDNSTWASGDWNADLEFDTSDLVAAFTEDGACCTPRLSAHVVPCECRSLIYDRRGDLPCADAEKCRSVHQ